MTMTTIQPNAAQAASPLQELQLWKVGENPTDYGVHVWSERSADLVWRRYAERGNPLLIDIEHSGSVVAESGRPAVTGGYARLEIRNGAPWVVFDWSSYAIEQIGSRQRLFISPEYDIDPNTNEITSLYRISLVADPGTYAARMVVGGAPLSRVEFAEVRANAAHNEFRIAARAVNEARAKGRDVPTDAVRIAARRLGERVNELVKAQAAAKKETTTMMMNARKTKADSAPQPSGPQVSMISEDDAPNLVVGALVRLNRETFDTVAKTLGLDATALAAALKRPDAAGGEDAIAASRRRASRGLQGAELEAMQREMGTYDPNAAAVRAGARLTRPELGGIGPYRTRDGFVLPTVPPSVWRERVAAAKLGGAR